MNCQQIHELLPELAAGMEAPSTEVSEHIAACSERSAQLCKYQKTRALLDEGRAPEPSQYFDTRLQARFREEIARPKATWLHWFRHPAWSMWLAAIVFAGAIGLGVGISDMSY